MIEVNLATVVAIVAVFLTFVSYVAAVQYRLGSLATQVENNERQIRTLQVTGATKSDITAVKDQLVQIQSGIDKLFDLDRARKNV